MTFLESFLCFWGGGGNEAQGDQVMELEIFSDDDKPSRVIQGKESKMNGDSRKEGNENYDPDEGDNNLKTRSPGALCRAVFLCLCILNV